jgi:hypothetical protein
VKYLVLCKILGFHGGGYEEYRLLGHKNPSSYFTGNTLRLLNRTKRVYAKQGFHGGDYEECRLLRCDAVWLLQDLDGVTSHKTAFSISYAFVVTGCVIKCYSSFPGLEN